MHRVVAAFALFASACAATRQPASEEVGNRVQREQAAEYSVYSYLLQGSPAPIIVSDSTVPPFQGRAVFCFEPDSKPQGCLNPKSATEAWKDFARKNRSAWPHLPLFDKSLNVTLKRDATLPEATCSGPTIVSFSRVGFNHDLTQAVVSITIVTGKGPMPGCGHAHGSQMMLELTESGWKAFGEGIHWVT